MSVSAKLFVSPLKAFSRRQLKELFEMFKQSILQSRRGCIAISMGAAQGLGNDVIDKFEFEQVFGGDLERLGGFRRGSAIFPKNRSTAFRTNHRIISVFENKHAIRD